MNTHIEPHAAPSGILCRVRRIRILFCWAAALLLSAQLASAAEERESVDETREVTGNERITLRVMRGDVVIRGSDAQTFRVSGLLDEEAEGYELTSSNGVTRFEVDMPRGNRFRGRGARSELEFEVPVGSHVEYSGIDGNVQISNVTGSVDVSTINAAIEAQGLGDVVELSTINGAIDSRGNSGRVTLKTVNGAIDDRQSSGRVEISSANGAVDIESSAGVVNISTVNGRVRAMLRGTEEMEFGNVNARFEVTLSESPAPRIDGSTVNGFLELILDPQVSARFSLQSMTGGNIRNGLSDDEPESSRFGPGRRLEFSAGDGRGSVDLHSVSGTLEVRID